MVKESNNNKKKYVCTLRSKLRGRNNISFNDVLIDIFALKLITTQKNVIVEHKRELVFHSKEIDGGCCL